MNSHLIKTYTASPHRELSLLYDTLYQITPHQLELSPHQSALRRRTPDTITLRIVKPYLESERKSGTRDKESTKGDSEEGSRIEHDGGGCGGEDCDSEDCDEEDLDDRDLEDQYRDDQCRYNENRDDEYCIDDEYGDGGSSGSDDEYGDVDLAASTKRKRASAQVVTPLKRGRVEQKAASGDIDEADAQPNDALDLATLGLECDDGEVIKLVDHDEGSTTKAPGRNASYEKLSVARKFHRNFLDFLKLPGEKGAEKVLPVPTLRRGNLFA
ncbi:hypothetical protein LTR95_012748, partial [Oleoguttula sp. CCFEE 5521]